ncbi:hypothetical protein [Halolamina rubra]|uniref:hypothetical protein n=1 Tax=Halolamina rubra TaxID=1380430 RepID=UPI000678C37C|nr:hypothetical protein [Halolamina rubra]
MGDLGVLVRADPDVTVANNQLSRLNPLDSRGHVMGYEDVDGETVTDNTVTGSKESLPDFGWQFRGEGAVDEWELDPRRRCQVVVDARRSDVDPPRVRSHRESRRGSRELALYCASLSLHDDQGDSLVNVDQAGPRRQQM